MVVSGGVENITHLMEEERETKMNEEKKDKIIEDIEKTDSNSNERIRVALRSFQETQFLDIRKFYKSEESGEYFPTRKGLAIPLNLIPQLKEALVKVLEEVEDWSVRYE